MFIAPNDSKLNFLKSLLTFCLPRLSRQLLKTPPSLQLHSVAPSRFFWNFLFFYPLPFACFSQISSLPNLRWKQFHLSQLPPTFFPHPLPRWIQQIKGPSSSNQKSYWVIRTVERLRILDINIFDPCCNWKLRETQASVFGGNSECRECLLFSWKMKLSWTL